MRGMVLTQLNPVRRHVVDILRHEIFSLSFAPGEKLVERQLCELTGASRTALREGLRQLEAEGLVEIVPNRGPMIPNLTIEQVGDIYEMRICLETLLVQKAALAASGHDIAKLRKIRDQVHDAIRRQKRLELIEAKKAYYDWLMIICNNEEVTLTMRRLLGRCGLIWPKIATTDANAAEGNIEEFDRIIEAICAHEPEQAAVAVKTHLDTAQNLLVTFLHKI